MSSDHCQMFQVNSAQQTCSNAYGWRFYSVLLAVLTATSVLFFFLLSDKSLVDFIQLVLMSIWSFAFISFVFLKNVIFSRLRSFFLILFLFYASAYEYFPNVLLNNIALSGVFYVLAIINFIASIPAYYVLFMHGAEK